MFMEELVLKNVLIYHIHATARRVTAAVKNAGDHGAGDVTGVTAMNA